MINTKNFLKILKENDLAYFSGVPDSTFKELISEICEDKEVENRISANECEAIATATGYHLSTKKIGVVYMQNSGFGKTINPITSLISKEVYSIPIILFIGYRGEPGEKDEPQHKTMGKLTLPFLKMLEIPYEILFPDYDQAGELIRRMKELAEKTNYAVAIVIKKGVFEGDVKKEENKYELLREEAINLIINEIKKESIIISTTGKTSRELFEQRKIHNQENNDFLTVGSMGCSSAIALEIAMQKPSKEIYCFDGDGAMIMQMGTFATIGKNSPKNFKHFLFDNNSYDSTGGQKTNSDSLDFEKIALACGYKYAKTIFNKKELVNELKKIENVQGPVLMVIKIKKGSRKDLGRPTNSPLQNKTLFMEKFE